MSDDDAGRIADILDCCQMILDGTRGKTREQVEADPLVVKGILWNIAIIGEASKNLSTTVKAQCPQVEWRRMAGMRDWLVHAYKRIDMGVVWLVVETRIPELLRTLQTFKDEHQS